MTSSSIRRRHPNGRLLLTKILEAPVLHCDIHLRRGSDSVDFAVLTNTDEHGKCWDTNVTRRQGIEQHAEVATAVDVIPRYLRG
jgi:hypothetical protein